MIDLPFSAVERIFKAGLAIKKAVQTVRRNKKECRDIERCVARIGALLSLLNETTEPIRHPAITAPLEDLAESLEEALELIIDCQEKNAVRRFFTAGDMAKQLLRVQDDILRKLTLGNFACNVQVTITLTNTIRCVGGSHHLLPQMPDTTDMEISCSSSSTMGGARSRVNTEITMAATGNVPLSGLLESTSSVLDATMQQCSEIGVNGGGHSFELQVKIMIKVDIMSKKCSTSILKTVFKIKGTKSITLNPENSTVMVVGDDLDPVTIMMCLRKTIGPAMLLSVEKERTMVGAEEAQEEEPNTRLPRARRSGGIRAITSKLFRIMWPRARRNSTPPPPLPLLLTDSDALALAAASSGERREAPACTHVQASSSCAHLSGTPRPLLQQHQPTATPPLPVRLTFNLSKLRRRVRVPAVRQLTDEATGAT